MPPRLRKCDPEGVFDVMVLGIGADGARVFHRGATPDAGAWVTPAGEPARDDHFRADRSRAARRRDGDRARHAEAVVAALRDRRDPAARCRRRAWVVDRAAAARLLSDAKPVEPQGY
jgi:hypothetical protein